MITTYRKERSFHGHSLDVLKSGLQKYIRRGMFDKALYCCFELKLFKNAEGGARIYTNFIHRLYVILLEDVGNISILSLCLKGICSGEFEGVIALMCFSDKARICSHARAVFTAQKDQWENPLIADIHKEIDHTDTNLEGLCDRFVKNLQVKHKSAIYYAFQIANSTEKLSKSYKRRRSPVWFIFQKLSVPMFESMFMELKNLKESYLCWLLPLLHCLDIVPFGSIPVIDPKVFVIDEEKHKEQPSLEMDDFVYDKHTRKGTDKSRDRFVNVGAVVNSEASFIIPNWKSFYTRPFVEKEMDDDFVSDKRTKKGTDKSRDRTVKVTRPCVEEKLDMNDDFDCDKYTKKGTVRVKVGDPVNLEANMETKYDFIMRAQLVTRSGGQDTYYAYDLNHRDIIFIKGPFADEKKVKNVMDLLEWKKKYNLPFIEARVEYMVPNRWMDGTPLGLRNSLDRNKAYPFLINESVLTDLNEKMHSSKLWPPTEVCDTENVNFHLGFEKLTFDEMVDYVLNLLMRFVFGVGDLADRNFIHHKGRIVSIDEDCRGKEVDFKRDLKKKRCSAISLWLKEYHESHIKPRISEWDNDSLIRLENILDKFT